MTKSDQIVIDLFCGCGGFSLGFERAGFHVALGIDVWKDALSTFKFNHKSSQVLQADLSNIKPSEVLPLLNGERVDVIIGGPPCQGFSVAGKRIVDDIRNKLYKNFVNFVGFYKPKAFVMENVPNILSIGSGVVRDEILKDFSDLGYTVEYRILTASDFGVPQNRRRAIFVGFRNGHHFIFPAPLSSDKITAEEAISDLPEQSLVDGEPYPSITHSFYQEQMRQNSLGVFNHQATEHNEKTKEIISLVPDGGNYKDLPIEFQGTRNVHIAWTRLHSKKPSFTIDTGHRHHFHYSYNRIPTARESARIQSFPDDFIFTCSKTSQLKQIGNAVPPLLGQAIAKALLEQL
ncbi:MAG: DNA cytosine methyltransferase [Bacteroidales bacterium]|nr:DNA cytosine methyltransferase [Bacteroidales bacterium]